MTQKQKHTRYLGLNSNVVRTCKITMSQFYRPKTVNVVILDVMITDKQGHITTIRLKENSRM